MLTTSPQPVSFERTKPELDHVLGLALGYVLSRQRRDGSWVDWALPPGESSIWTTAYIGGKLSGLPTGLKKWATVPTALAADWLSSEMFPDNGWGYNEEVGSDADSTALAIQFLASERREIPDGRYARLYHFQCGDGGFATYRGQPNLGSWATSHCDVTPAAVLAMMTKNNVSEEIIDRGIRFTLDQQTSGGIWNSFWWISPLYSTEASLSLLVAVGLDNSSCATRETLLAVEPKHPFDRSLLLSSLLLLRSNSQPKEMPLLDQRTDERIDELTDQLIEEQESDGSWRSAPMLRITNRNSRSPWKGEDPDPLFCDQNRLFTTTTVMAALSRLYKREPEKHC